MPSDPPVIQKWAGQAWVLQAVLALEKRIFSKADAWTDILEKEVKRRNTVLLCAYAARTSDQPAGYIIYTTNRLCIHISKVAVDIKVRRQGIARQLVLEALGSASRERKVMCATLHVDPANEAALRLYEGIGFIDDGVLEDYYRPGRPALKMLLPHLS